MRPILPPPPRRGRNESDDHYRDRAIDDLTDRYSDEELQGFIGGYDPDDDYIPNEP